MTKDRLKQDITIGDWVAFNTGHASMNVGKVKSFNKSGSPKIQISIKNKNLISPNWRFESGKSASQFLKIIPTNEMIEYYENQ